MAALPNASNRLPEPLSRRLPRHQAEPDAVTRHGGNSAPSSGFVSHTAKRSRRESGRRMISGPLAYLPVPLPVVLAPPDGAPGVELWLFADGGIPSDPGCPLPAEPAPTPVPPPPGAPALPPPRFPVDPVAPVPVLCELMPPEPGEPGPVLVELPLPLVPDRPEDDPAEPAADEPAVPEPMPAELPVPPPPAPLAPIPPAPVPPAPVPPAPLPPAPPPPPPAPPPPPPPPPAAIAAVIGAAARASANAKAHVLFNIEYPFFVPRQSARTQLQRAANPSWLTIAPPVSRRIHQMEK